MLIAGRWWEIYLQTALPTVEKIALLYIATPNTALAFCFKSRTQSEIHGIEFDSDSSLSRDRTFKLYGTHPWGIRAFNDYRGSAPRWKHSWVRRVRSGALLIYQHPGHQSLYQSRKRLLNLKSLFLASSRDVG